ncbi:Uncharacterized protein SAPIO_CDS3163 [Scedosporium apiospermum]|uniref:Zn(2)-C6 fungal-type domain-containing protein n=1 Tax=Pseudallescheria apiosperma TaxID=563466 RepID=A0A084GA62_PSEDA|nr:Uncharacterized protein SAPIO_CDS3163 [Scedosporium apiospermum]KEZ44224.1 Uncharacterized protein SAPIO_CDS3163 [Scedosporium apiospermum]
MTPTPPSTTPSSGGAHSPTEQFRVIRKRNRIPVSCQMCRAKKKCDRAHPCGNCVKRDGSSTTSCHYAATAPRKKPQTQAAAGPGDMQNRIDRLENLVLSLMHGGANVEVPSSRTESTGQISQDSTAVTNRSQTEGSSMSASTRTDQGDEGSDVDDRLATSLGVLKVDSEMGKSMYLGQEHWHSLLADIAEVKNYFVTHKKELERSYKQVISSKPAHALEGPVLLLGTLRTSEVELRAELPPKTTILALCERFFQSSDGWICIVHRPTFLRQLHAHWLDPSQTPLMWIGLLYSILCHAAISYHKAGDEPPDMKGRSLDIAAEYRLRASQCLVTADYTKAVEYSIETLTLYIFGEYSSRWDMDMALWLVLSLATRIAFRMGYHRDGKWFKSLTPYQAEMRRRVWAMVRMGDVVFSHHLSLPRMINDSDCDTELPRNLLDEDFGPESTELPPPRSALERTPVDYLIAKSKLCIEFGKILRATTNVGRQLTYDEVLQFDTDLRAIRAQFPPHLKISPLYDISEPPQDYMTRFHLDILYQKILTAIEASLAMLHHLESLHRETQPGGRLEDLKCHVASLALKDFNYPAALVAVELRYSSREAHETPISPFTQTGYICTPEQQREMLRTLEITRDIWQGMSHMSVDAYKAGAVLKILIESAKMARPREPSRSATPGAGVRLTGINSFVDSQDMRPEQSAALGLGMLAGSISPSSPPNFVSQSQNKLPPISQMDLPMSTGVAEPAMPPELQFDTFGANRPSSPPLSLFPQLGGNGVDTGEVDWDAFENYTQTMIWSVDPAFHIFGTGEDATQQNNSVNDPSKYPK